jgi:hypothetical protein
MNKLPYMSLPAQRIAHNRGLRHETKLRGEVHYFTGKECKNGHIEKRLVSSGSCMECVRLKAAQLRLKRSPEKKAQDRAYSRINAAQWRIANPDHENTKIVKRRWASEHPEQKNASTAKRRAAKLQRTPLWLTQAHHKQIEQFYWEAAEVSKVVGEFYHVDHIVPLQGRTVSGLHVPWNLQILPAKENLSKGNNHA